MEYVVYPHSNKAEAPMKRLAHKAEAMHLTVARETGLHTGSTARGVIELSPVYEGHYPLIVYYYNCNNCNCNCNYYYYYYCYYYYYVLEY